MKILLRRIHLYLAFVAGIVIMITCFTGAVLVFEEELQHFTSKKRYYVNVEDSRQSINTMLADLHQKVPGAGILGVKIYSDPSRSVEIIISVKKAGVLEKKNNTGNSKLSKTKADGGKRLIAFVNPYTGSVIEVYDHQQSFFFTIMSLHRWLLSGDIGKLIVGTCTLLFLFILITGIILWWPKTKYFIRQRLTLKLGSGWKRINHDLHIVLGFYSAIFLFIFAFTGLAWSFSWFNKGIYKITGSSMVPVKTPVSVIGKDTALLSYEEIYVFTKIIVPAVKYYTITPPKDSLDPYAVSVLPLNASHESATDVYYVDRYRPILSGTQKFSDRNLGQRVRSTFKPVHVASIFGIGSKIIGLIVCILGVIFPATGYIMWWLRTRKKAGKSVT